MSIPIGVDNKTPHYTHQDRLIYYVSVMRHSMINNNSKWLYFHNIQKIKEKRKILEGCIGRGDEEWVKEKECGKILFNSEDHTKRKSDTGIFFI